MEQKAKFEIQLKGFFFFAAVLGSKNLLGLILVGRVLEKISHCIVRLVLKRN